MTPEERARAAIRAYWRKIGMATSDEERRRILIEEIAAEIRSAELVGRIQARRADSHGSGGV